MKNLKKILPFLCIFSTLVTFFSCEKTDKNPSQNLLESFIADSLFKSPASVTESTFFTFGLSFQVNKPGSITEVSVKNPAPGTYKVTLWDTDTKLPIFSKTIEQEQAAKKTSVSVSAVNLIANKKYLFTQLSNSYTVYYPKSGKPIVFPHSKGNFVILSYQNATNTDKLTPLFPTNLVSSFISGEADFTFKPD